jgi:hypothetical protein
VILDGLTGYPGRTGDPRFDDLSGVDGLDGSPAEALGFLGFIRWAAYQVPRECGEALWRSVLAAPHPADVFSNALVVSPAEIPTASTFKPRWQFSLVIAERTLRRTWRRYEPTVSSSPSDLSTIEPVLVRDVALGVARGYPGQIERSHPGVADAFWMALRALAKSELPLIAGRPSRRDWRESAWPLLEAGRIREPALRELTEQDEAKERRALRDIEMLAWIEKWGSEKLRAHLARTRVEDRGLQDAYARERAAKELPGFTLSNGFGSVALPDRWETVSLSKREAAAVRDLDARLRKLGHDRAFVKLILSPYRPSPYPPSTATPRSRSSERRDDRDVSVWLEVASYPDERHGVRRRLTERRSDLFD